MSEKLIVLDFEQHKNNIIDKKKKLNHMKKHSDTKSYFCLNSSILEYAKYYIANTCSMHKKIFMENMEINKNFNIYKNFPLGGIGKLAYEKNIDIIVPMFLEMVGCDHMPLNVVENQKDIPCDYMEIADTGIYSIDGLDTEDIYKSISTNVEIIGTHIFKEFL